MTAKIKRPDNITDPLFDVHAYAARKPVEDSLAWFRANEPVAWIEHENYDPFWLVTKHKDILEVSAANARFLNEAGKPVQLLNQAMAPRAVGDGSHQRTLVQMNAPDHLKYRAITQTFFMPKNLRGREDRIREAARKAVDKLLARGEQCDFAADLAEAYPLHIVMDILGVPEEHEAQMLTWSKQLISQQDPEFWRGIEDDPTGMKSYMAVIEDLFKYFTALTYERRANPMDDVASIIANSKIDSVQISDMDALGYYIIIATAGHDTTSSSTGGAAWMLAQQPNLLARVKADPSLIPKVVDEAIRWTTPVQHFMRTAAEDTVIGDQAIAKGDWICLSYLSGNRDEDIFDVPNAFDIDRSPNRHISFGFGAHLCLGQHLAKMEMRILLEELLPRVVSMELTGPTRAVASNFVWGPKQLPMRIRPS